ncbi:VanZ family protein [Streptomyces decoyicus]|uniref:VanZ family protein n=1 Tax=Streptomyces decoyicus TaxID=249567 RepID=UPI0033F1AFC7
MFFPVTFLIGLLGGVALYAVTTRRRSPRQMSQRVALGLLWLWAACVVYFTFGTPSGGGQALNLKPLDLTNAADIKDAVLNVLMFAPVGLLLARLPVRWYQATLFGFLGSLTIEVTQYLTRSGRSADINDLTSNTLGALIGFSCTAAVLALARHSSRIRGTTVDC